MNIQRFASEIFLFAVLALTCLARPLDDFDIFTQIALGRLAIENGSLLLQEPFLLHVSAQWVNPGWLWQILAAGVVHATSLAGLRILDALLFSGAILLALAAFKRTHLSFTPAVISFCLIGIPIFSSASVRPQTLALFCFGLVYFLLKTTKASVLKGFFLVIVFCFWQNCHSSLLLAFPLIALADQKKGLFSCCNRERILLGIACALATVSTPLGLSIFEFSAHNRIISKDVLHISEWYGLFSVPLDFLPLVRLSFAIGFLCLFILREHVSLKDAVLSFCFFVATCIAIRFYIFWILVSLPIIAQAIDASGKKLLPGYSRPLKRSLAVLTLVVLLFNASPTPLIHNRIPLSCTATLPTNKEELRVFNDHTFGGVIAYSHGRASKIASDGRLYLQSEEYWNQFFQYVYGEKKLDNLLDEFSVDAFLLNPNRSPILIKNLQDSKGWQQLHSDSYCVAFSRI